MCIYKAVWIQISMKTSTGPCYTFLVYDQDEEKQKDFKNVMIFRGKIVSTGQLYKPLAEKHKFGKYSKGGGLICAHAPILFLLCMVNAFILTPIKMHLFVLKKKI